MTMNTVRGCSYNPMTNTLSLTANFVKKASRLGTAEYKMVLQYQKDHPGLEIVELKKDNEHTRDAVTYTRMEQTINAMDTIHEAIESDCQLRFHYFQYDTKKRQILTKNGREYRVSPYALIYHEDVYYLLCVPYHKSTLAMYRVDRMLYVETVNKEREHKEVFNRENIDRLSNGTFGDEIGTLEEISFLVRHELLDKVYDRFGLDVNVQRYDDKYSLVITSVVPNRAFFGWLVMMGEDLIIVSPEEVNTDFCGTLMKIRRNYHSAMYWNHYRSLFAYMWEDP